MKKVVCLYEGSYQFHKEETDLNVTPDYIQYKLARQFEYRETKETLWATISEDGKEVARYKFDNQNGLIEITINSTNVLAKGESIKFLDYTIKMCGNNDGIVLFKDGTSGYQSHLGNYGTNVDSAKKAAIIYFMIARPHHFAFQICNKILRGNQSGCVSEYSLFADVVKKEGLIMPDEVTAIDGANRLIGYKGEVLKY